MRKVWIEAALNGAWTRALQPGIPDTVEAIIAEGVACARAGATIIHTHAYDGGGPKAFATRWTFPSIPPTHRSTPPTLMAPFTSRTQRSGSPISRRLLNAA